MTVKNLNALNFTQLKEKVSLSRSHIWNLEQAGKFPKRFSIGVRGVRWLESDIDAWLQAQANKATTPTP